MSYYRLAPNGAVKHSEVFESNGNRFILQTKWYDFTISTVFLSIDHGPGGSPILFETMIFDNREGSDDDIYMERYSTYKQAVAGHTEAIAWLTRYKQENSIQELPI